nr:hypothetical protein [Pseudomonas amygdali]
MSKPQKLTFGQIYRELVRAYARAPAIHVCVGAVDTLVREGFWSPQESWSPISHFLIPSTSCGLTEIGAASRQL